MSEMNEKKSQVPTSGFGQNLWEVIKIIVISLVIVLPIRYYIAQPFIVRGASMEPNFEDREYLVIDELSFYFREPKRHEVIVFRYPRDPRQFFIKRIIGLPGERVEISKGKVKVINAEKPDGFTLDEQYLNPPNRPTYPDLGVTLGQGEYFVLGDNRDFSSDSRVWGALSEDRVVGRVVFRAWPVGKFGTVSLGDKIYR